jgi:crotonobetainyl-CoA:carnitine CoA-transferase CaiB-like acyl-CoA transferase
MGALEARGVLCAPVNRYADLEGDPQIRASEIIVEEEHCAGRFRTVDTVRFAKTPGTRRTGAPAPASTPTQSSARQASPKAH